MSSYPSSNPALATLVDGVDYPQAADINTVAREVEAIGAALRDGLAHDLKFTDATYDIGKSGATRPRDGFFSRNLVVGGTATFGGVQTAAAQPRARAYNSAAQSIPNNTLTPLTFDSEDYDVGGLHSTSVNPTRMTIPAGGDGPYLIIAKAFVTGGAGGASREIRITKNGSAVGTSTVVAPSAGTNLQISVVNMEALVATDYIEAFVYQDSGGALNIGSSTRVQAAELSIVKLW